MTPGSVRPQFSILWDLVSVIMFSGGVWLPWVATAEDALLSALSPGRLGCLTDALVPPCLENRLCCSVLPGLNIYLVPTLPVVDSN